MKLLLQNDIADVKQQFMKTSSKAQQQSQQNLQHTSYNLNTINISKQLGSTIVLNKFTDEKLLANRNSIAIFLNSKNISVQNGFIYYETSM